MQEKVVIELGDLSTFINYGKLYPTKKFIKTCKKLKLNHTAGTGWPILEQDKLPLVAANCSVWIDDNSEPQITIENIYSKELLTESLSLFQEINKNVLGILWIDRAFEID